MGYAASITTTLHAAYQTAKERGFQSRPLLTLLVEMDNGEHLDGASREHVLADIVAFTHVSQTFP